MPFNVLYVFQNSQSIYDNQLPINLHLISNIESSGIFKLFDRFIIIKGV